MAEFINPAIVPKVTLPSGEKVPCMGMGTFGSDRVSAEEVSEAVAGAIRSGYRFIAWARASSGSRIILHVALSSLVITPKRLCCGFPDE